MCVCACVRVCVCLFVFVCGVCKGLFRIKVVFFAHRISEQARHRKAALFVFKMSFVLETIPNKSMNSPKTCRVIVQVVPLHGSDVFVCGNPSEIPASEKGTTSCQPVRFFTLRQPSKCRASHESLGFRRRLASRKSTPIS